MSKRLSGQVVVDFDGNEINGKNVRLVSERVFENLGGDAFSYPAEEYTFGEARIAGREIPVVRARPTGRGRPTKRWNQAADGQEYSAAGSSFSSF